MMATGKKVATATAERPLFRASPQSMCPEVQPFDIFHSLGLASESCDVRLTLVPKPTNAPTPIVAIAACIVVGTAGYLVSKCGARAFKGA